jgi:hypothetical protein
MLVVMRKRPVAPTLVDELAVRVVARHAHVVALVERDDRRVVEPGKVEKKRQRGKA